jgi:hypothetical protein
LDLAVNSKAHQKDGVVPWVERGTKPLTGKDPIGQHEGEADPPEIAVANGLSVTLPLPTT